MRPAIGEMTCGGIQSGNERAYDGARDNGDLVIVTVVVVARVETPSREDAVGAVVRMPSMGGRKTDELRLRQYDQTLAAAVASKTRARK